MSATSTKRATVYLPADLHKAVKVKAGLSSKTISEVIGEAILDSLREDASDISALENTKNEESITLQDVLKEFNLEHLDPR